MAEFIVAILQHFEGELHPLTSSKEDAQTCADRLGWQSSNCKKKHILAAADDTSKNLGSLVAQAMKVDQVSSIKDLSNNLQLAYILTTIRKGREASMEFLVFIIRSDHSIKRVVRLINDVFEAPGISQVEEYRLEAPLAMAILDFGRRTVEVF